MNRTLHLLLSMSESIPDLLWNRILKQVKDSGGHMQELGNNKYRIITSDNKQYIVTRLPQPATNVKDKEDKARVSNG